MSLSIRQLLKRRAFRKAKKEVVLRSEDFKLSELLALSNALRSFYIDILNWEVSHIKQCNPFELYAGSVVEVIEMIELIVSNDTDFKSRDWAFGKINEASDISSSQPKN